MARMRLLVFAMTILPAIPASTTWGDEPTSKVASLFRAWDRPDSPGAVVAVVRGGATLLAKGYGMADLEHDVPIGPRTVFHVASVSKQFTAFGILLLAEQGKLSPDDDIRKYLPDVPDFGRPISIRQLVHHTSGLRDQWDLLQMAGWRMDDVITQRQILRMVGRQRDLNFTPGSEHLYCNTGYTLLAEIVGRVGGRPFPDWMQRNVFEPLGMGRTLFYDDHERIVKGRADSYRPSGDGTYKKAVLSFANVGATSLFTTAEDLARWVANLGDPKLGGARVMARMVERGKLDSGAALDYASGLSIDDYRGLRRIGHNGADAGFRSYIGRFPDQDLGVIVLSNLASFDPEGMAMRVAELYLGERMTRPARPNAPPVAQPLDVFPLPSAVLDDFVGSYESRDDSEMTIIHRAGDRLFLEASTAKRRALIPLSASSFITRRGDQRLKFSRDAAGKVSRLTASIGGLTPQSGRIGVSMKVDEKDRNPIIESLDPGMPAARDGRMRAGDRLVGVEAGGKLDEFRGRPFDEVVKRLDGPVGSKLRVVLERAVDGSRETIELTRELSDEGLVSVRVEPFAPTSEELATYTGLYVSPELESSYRLIVENGALIAVHPRHEAMTLRPIHKDRFAGGILGEVRFLRNAEGRVSGLTATTGRVRNLRFDRRD